MALAVDFDFEEIVEKIAKVPALARMGVVMALLLAIAGGYYSVSYQAKRSELVNLRGQADELQRKLNKVRVVASNLSDFKQEVAGLERSLGLALKQLPNRKQFEDLLRDISTAGKKVGVTINSIERTKEVDHSFYAEVPFKISIEGTYHDVARFFEQLANLQRIVNMGSMTISVASQDEFNTMLEVKGTATTFRFIKKG
jgi:type IV pilus assembly protein PilO